MTALREPLSTIGYRLWASVIADDRILTRG